MLLLSFYKDGFDIKLPMTVDTQLNKLNQTKTNINLSCDQPSVFDILYSSSIKTHCGGEIANGLEYIAAYIPHAHM